MGQAASQGEHLEDAFMRTLGLQIQHLAPGEAVVAGVVGEEHLNLHGTVHGGFLYALADSAFALASNSRGPAVALSCRMDYFRPLSAGARVEARAQEVNLSRRTATYRVEVVSEGKLVALFTGTVFRLGGDAFPGAGEGLSSGQNAWRKEEG
ncbi:MULTISPECIES: hydroxyphenylacetyl-CoA thioesterase PaaI [Thermus]|uniref:Phenylacetic acid degradation protein n=1 Tax=Thermus scotoductus TaxID=37636 RepID=A0A0N1KP64_THESC|nr:MULTISPECIES: hydroxyphenylacetyl-CoA thioesterase PaaI [Thermus]KPD28038.1 phenylacetic acid degradation protein [Thermus scotoductus]RTG91605.1 phenylacetic acid degradation protein PaaD [Thermus scotoductus]RTG98577.1 phenylacetic acid degradation protein PaaD [Thermus scotoductus]RTH06516.1 phenylacetic acid degradation protein PaaD [Thermus scotoductus]RTH06591.1 phenylacetic acid degradation protein PaaD [Thermus scotoductus]